MRILLAAPYVGEFGWELLSWQARVRWVFHRGGFDRLVMLGAPGRAAFYADMPLEYHATDLSNLEGTAYEDRRFDLDTRQPVAAEQIRARLAARVEALAAPLREWHYLQVLWPPYSGWLWPTTPRFQEFIRFRRPCVDPPGSPWVVFVQRQRTIASNKNWPIACWEALADRLLAAGIHTSIYPVDTAEAIAALSACDLAVGCSTGGLHLASLSGCPHVVWSTGDDLCLTRWEFTNRQRYETFWNPLGTPVHYHASEDHPDPGDVARWVTRAVHTIGRRTGTRGHRLRAHACWSLKTVLAWHVAVSRWFRQFPWPVQRWLRYDVL